ncbi:hypothetical protein D1872_344570 [compost metagenome]
MRISFTFDSVEEYKVAFLQILLVGHGFTLFYLLLCSSRKLNVKELLEHLLYKQRAIRYSSRRKLIVANI